MKLIIAALALLTLTGCDRINYELYSQHTMDTCEKRERTYTRNVQSDPPTADYKYSTYKVMKCYNARMDAYVDHGIETDENGVTRVVKRSY